MDTQNPPLPPDNDHRPLDQQDPAVQPGSPAFGSFGHPSNAANAAPGRSGANDNPDEFSEFSDREKDAQKAPDNPEDQPGHVTQNQNPELVRKVQAEGGDTEELRKAWAEDDPRYAGGGTHNTREEPADAKYPAKDE